MQETWVQSLGREELLEKEMATHSSILAWRIPWTEEPGGLQSMGSQRLRHDGASEHTRRSTEEPLFALVVGRPVIPLTSGSGFSPKPQPPGKTLASRGSCSERTWLPPAHLMVLADSCLHAHNYTLSYVRTKKPFLLAQVGNRDPFRNPQG